MIRSQNLTICHRAFHNEVANFFLFLYPLVWLRFISLFLTDIFYIFTPVKCLKGKPLCNMKTSVILRENIALNSDCFLYIALVVDFLLMYEWPEGRVSRANRNCTSDFTKTRLQICMIIKLNFDCLDTKIRTGVNTKPILLTTFFGYFYF
jgi:hypothetical protein